MSEYIGYYNTGRGHQGSQYMAVLQRGGLVTSTRIGQWTRCKRDDALLERLSGYLATEL